MSWSILQADARRIPLADESVQCVVTSPPYFGLRDYGTARWKGGAPECDHEPDRSSPSSTLEGGKTTQGQARVFREKCPKCGARRIDAQLGLESTPEEYVADMVAVFREVWRVLRDDGTVWLNLGDSYNGGGTHHGSKNIGLSQSRKRQGFEGTTSAPGLKPKDLVGIPWRVAFALQADGWYLRSDCIWHKTNPMPESVTDRPTKAHEYLFLLAKGQWVTRVVQFSNLPSQRFHFGDNLRPDRQSVRGSARLPVDLATTIFDCTQREQEFRLPPFYSEVWKQGDDGADSDFVRGLPEEHRPAVWAARFLCANATAEQFLCEIDRLRIAHADDDDFLKRWAVPLTVPDAPSITSDGKGTVTVHYPGEICKIEFCFHTVSISRPSKCVYYYDAQAIAEPSTGLPGGRFGAGGVEVGRLRHDAARERPPDTGTRNRRSVWTIPTHPYRGAHFAVMPPALVEVCVRAGTSERGCCPKCHAPWERIVEKMNATRTFPDTGKGIAERKADGTNRRAGSVIARTVGWRTTCSCDAGNPVPCAVLDPFSGAGTTVMVANRLGRDGVGLDLNAGYGGLARDRILADMHLRMQGD